MWRWHSKNAYCKNIDYYKVHHADRTAVYIWQDWPGIWNKGSRFWIMVSISNPKGILAKGSKNYKILLSYLKVFPTYVLLTQRLAGNCLNFELKIQFMDCILLKGFDICSLYFSRTFSFLCMRVKERLQILNISLPKLLLTLPWLFNFCFI